MSASSLHVNVAKTVCVPLYAATVLQCKKDIGYTPWAGMEINMAVGMYLGFLVGPGASAKLNLHRLWISSGRGRPLGSKCAGLVIFSKYWASICLLHPYSIL